MKHLAILLSLFTLNSSLLTLSAAAAVPLRWTVETSAANHATFDQFAGATYDLEATLQSRGKPLAITGDPKLYWQTNGMGSAWWTAPATVSGNVLRATWTPACDVGARVYNCFIGITGTVYNAAFQLRLRPSPGATPNELPLPQKVIDFDKVTVLNPPWSGGGGGGIDTNAVIDIVHKTVDGAARPLPKYLHLLDFDDSYPDAAEEYYTQRGGAVPAAQCSSVRDGGFLYRNFDYTFDDRAEFVMKMSAGAGRFASVGVAQVGTNITEQFVVSGKPSRCYKWLPGATVDGINENGVACNINVVDGPPQWGGGVSPALHPLAAVRWILDHATNAQHAATYIASHIAFPPGWTQNFHYMIADATSTYIVEDGGYAKVDGELPVLTNFLVLMPDEGGPPVYSPEEMWESFGGEGKERFDLLNLGTNITNAWWTLTYTPAGYRASDLPGITGSALTQLFNYWENNPRESHRGETFGDVSWWQTVHTSIYDLTNKTLKISVQETDDWYVFAVGQTSAALGQIEEQLSSHASQLSQLSQSKRDKTDYFTEWSFSPHVAPSPEVKLVVKIESENYAEWAYVNSGEEIERVTGTFDQLVIHFPEAGVTATRDIIARKSEIGKCVKNTFGEWTTGFDTDRLVGQPYVDTRGYWIWEMSDGTTVGSIEPADEENDTEIEFLRCAAFNFTATRQRIATSGESFVTQSFVTNKADRSELDPISEDARNAYLYSRSINLYMTANTNAWFAGTNYVFGADAATRQHFAWEPGMDAATVPCSMALYEIRDRSKQCVWDQRDWVSWYWSFKANQMREEIAATNAAIYAAITNDENNAWARRYAATGRVNPDASTTYIDTKAVCLSPGMNWETVATVGGCGYWTIVGNGAVIGGSGTNAVLEIKDFEGNSILRITKGEHRLAWLDSGDFVGQMTDADGWVCFDMMANVQPVGYFSTTLESADFVAETDSGCPVQYSWENLGNGKWRVHFLLKPGIVSATCFAKFQVEIEGKTQVIYEAGVCIDEGLIYNGVTIAPVIPQDVEVGDTVNWKVIAK